jgi:hypothetical protein
MQEAPKLDSRSGEEIFRSVASDLKQSGLGIDADGDGRDPLAGALLRVFSRYCELIIQRLNRVPEKNWIAFVNVLNISPVPPIPAQVPLTFIPVKKLPKEPPKTRAGMLVPSYTRVAAAPAEGESEPAVYETMQALRLTNIALSKVVALDPLADLWTDKGVLATREGGPGEFAFDAKEPIDHAFFIGHGRIFGKVDISELRLQFDIDPRRTPDDVQPTIVWWIPTPKGEVPLTPVRDTTSHLARSGEVVFDNLPEWPLHTIFHRETQWLGCRLLARLQSWAAADGERSPSLPLIRTVKLSATWEVEDTAVNQAFFNNLPLDLSKDFFPFGERPRFGDVWYLSCDVFGKPETHITLHIKLTNPASAGTSAPIPAVYTAGQPKIQWEHWNGRHWVVLECQDGTQALTQDGDIVFLIPSPFPATEVNGLAGFWIRARLVAGNYGEEERLEFSAQDQGPRRIASTLAPPSIQSIQVTSSLNVGPELPETIVTHNELAFEEVNSAVPFQPFRAALEPRRGLYLGFQVADDDQRALADRGVDLYFHVHGSQHRPSIRTSTAQGLPTLIWQYWNGRLWTAAHLVADGTESLTMPGIVSLRDCDDIAWWHESSLNAKLHWFRVLWTAGEFESSPVLRHLLLNTVLATQTFTLQDERLGSSTGLPHQTFRSARVPILHDLQLEVREPDLPSKEELARVTREEGEEAVTTIHDTLGRLEQIWVRWHEVPDFLTSSNRDRHFLVDRQSGEIHFGDGTRGLIPPVGVNNIRLRRYQTGGGAFGNQPAGSITQLRTSVPYVDAVVNLEPALGGHNGEGWESIRERGARWLRHRERAVTKEDYEDLAKLASPVVAKARCYPNLDLSMDAGGMRCKPGVVSLILVPHSTDPRPVPELTLLRRVRDFLNERRARDSELVLLAPEYVRVSVEAVVAAAAGATSANIVEQCEDEVNRYLHPLTGGPDGKGWEFGRRPHESDLYARLGSICEVDHVQSLSITLTEERPGLLGTESFLICAGALNIRLHW